MSRRLPVTLSILLFIIFFINVSTSQHINCNKRELLNLNNKTSYFNNIDNNIIFISNDVSLETKFWGIQSFRSNGEICHETKIIPSSVNECQKFISFYYQGVQDSRLLKEFKRKYHSFLKLYWIPDEDDTSFSINFIHKRESHYYVLLNITHIAAKDNTMISMILPKEKGVQTLDVSPLASFKKNEKYKINILIQLGEYDNDNRIHQKYNWLNILSMHQNCVPKQEVQIDHVFYECFEDSFLPNGKRRRPNSREIIWPGIERPTKEELTYYIKTSLVDQETAKTFGDVYFINGSRRPDTPAIIWPKNPTNEDIAVYMKESHVQQEKIQKKDISAYKKSSQVQLEKIQKKEINPPKNVPQDQPSGWEQLIKHYNI